MPERGFDTSFWTKPFVQNLSPHGKLLITYLKTNAHCNQAGVYTITPSTIAFETGLPLAEIPDLLKSLEPEVAWYPEENVVWVKSFLEEQAKSSKFIASALNIITRNRLPEDIPEDFQEYNSRVLARITTDYPIGLTKRECVAIRDKFTCQYCQKVIKLPNDYEMDHIIPKTRGGKSNYQNLVTSCRECNQKKLDKTPDEVGLITPHARTFHAAQAVFLLKNSPELRSGWLQLFPEREAEVDSILSNIEQRYSILTQDTPLSASVSVSDTVSSSKSVVGGGGGTPQVKIQKATPASPGPSEEAEGEPSVAEERKVSRPGLPEAVEGLSTSERDILSFLCRLKGWRGGESGEDSEWLKRFLHDFPRFTLVQAKACADYHSGRDPPAHKGIWKNRLRTWMVKEPEFARGGRSFDAEPGRRKDGDRGRDSGQGRDDGGWQYVPGEGEGEGTVETG